MRLLYKLTTKKWESGDDKWFEKHDSPAMTAAVISAVIESLSESQRSFMEQPS